jgi:hypothetical protein
MLPSVVSKTKAFRWGGDLPKAPEGEGKSPTFLMTTLKDPIGANLDRVQVIKGWVNRDDKTQERIHDVAVSGGREIGADGRCKTSRRSSIKVVVHFLLEARFAHDPCIPAAVISPLSVELRLIAIFGNARPRLKPGSTDRCIVVLS